MGTRTMEVMFDKIQRKCLTAIALAYGAMWVLCYGMLTNTVEKWCAGQETIADMYF